ncbi:hypothetical protein V6N11_068849 [Hibiscus sabdariffa]|uniref:TF-B3 domain-containing protein n=1 Tax=Hibiscus sabdariffa TaxID=183260 RepID=A0ABR2PAZ1_9ROSI
MGYACFSTEQLHFLASTYSYLLSAMAYFEKYLTEVDVRKQVAIPTDFVKHLPDYEGGHTITFPVRDVSGKVWENFGYYIRREGNDYPKPVFQKDWRKYVRDKRLGPGDKIIF